MKTLKTTENFFPRHKNTEKHNFQCTRKLLGKMFGKVALDGLRVATGANDFIIVTDLSFKENAIGFLSVFFKNMKPNFYGKGLLI